MEYKCLLKKCNFRKILHFFNFQAITGFEDMHFLQKFFKKFTLEKMQGRLRIQSETTQDFAKSAV